MFSRPQSVMIGVMPMRKRRAYGPFSFLFDLLMIGITGGLWLVWIFVREMRNR